MPFAIHILFRQGVLHLGSLNAQVILHLRHTRSHQYFGHRLLFLLGGDARHAGPGVGRGGLSRTAGSQSCEAAVRTGEAHNVPWPKMTEIHMSVLENMHEHAIKIEYVLRLICL